MNFLLDNDLQISFEREMGMLYLFNSLDDINRLNFLNGIPTYLSRNVIVFPSLKCSVIVIDQDSPQIFNYKIYAICRHQNARNMSHIKNVT
jgi:hypothetical protein